MVKTILVLKDGTEVMAGREQENAIQSVTVEEACNDSQDLMVGSTCSAKVVVDIITPRNKMVIDAGEQFELFEEENGIRRKKGVFNAEKPQKKNSNVTRIEAYDNISLLDKDVTEWFNSLNAFPYTVYNMANLVCIQCGLSLLNENIPNGDFLIQETEFNTVTARQIIRWIAEISGCFCVANCDGQVWYRWYQPNNTPITPNKSEDTTMFLGGGLKYEDYQTQKIDAVRIIGDEHTETVYPPNINPSNVYVIDGNPFLENKSNAVMQIAESLYNVLRNMEYTPCMVDIPASFVYGIGDIVDITDANGVNFSALVMRKSRSGQKERIEATGNAKRNGATELYDTGFKKTYSETRKNKKSIADIKTEASSNRASIEAFAEWQANITNDDGTLKVETSLSSFEAYAEENYAKTSMLSQYSTKGETGEAIQSATAEVLTEVSETYATISSLAEFEEGTSKSIALITEKVSENTAEIALKVSVVDYDAKVAEISLAIDENKKSVAKIEADILEIDVSDKVTIGDSIVIDPGGSFSIRDTFGGDGTILSTSWDSKSIFFSMDSDYSATYGADAIFMSGNQHQTTITPEEIHSDHITGNTAMFTNQTVTTLNVSNIIFGTGSMYVEDGYVKWRSEV